MFLPLGDVALANSFLREMASMPIERTRAIGVYSSPKSTRPAYTDGSATPNAAYKPS